MSFNIFGAIARAVGEVVVQVVEAPARVMDVIEDTADRIIEGDNAPSPVDGLETSSGWSGPIHWTDDRCPSCYRDVHKGFCRR